MRVTGLVGNLTLPNRNEERPVVAFRLVAKPEVEAPAPLRRAVIARWAHSH